MEALHWEVDMQNYHAVMFTHLKSITGLLQWFLLVLKSPSRGVIAWIHLYSYKQYVFQCEDLKEYDSLSPTVSLCVSPFLFHILYISGITEINALPSFLWRGLCCPWSAPFASYQPSAALTKASTYHPVSLYLLPSSHSPSCRHGLVYEPLSWKDRLMEDLAQLRPAWFSFVP